MAVAAYRPPASGSRESPLLCGREPASSRTADERGLRDLGEAKAASAFSASALFWGLELIFVRVAAAHARARAHSKNYAYQNVKAHPLGALRPD
jgi:hypothetical protein